MKSIQAEQTKKEIQKELVMQALEEKTKEERDDLIKFMSYFFKNEKHKDFATNWHYHLLADKLKGVIEGKVKRLIINIPPRHGKTELITKSFPVWALGNNPTLEIIATSYSATLAQEFSSEARDYYTSKTFKKVFPRADAIRESQNTKDYWKLASGGSYYATGSGGTITGRGANIFIIDDPLKPDEVDSDIKRIGINNWFENTVVSRLNNPKQDSIIIIMQRLHDNDLCGYLMEKMGDGTGGDWDIVSLPAIAEEDEEFTIGEKTYGRKEGEALFEARYPVEILEQIRKGRELIFSCQYQQDPVSKDNQEFHEEWFKYYDDLPNENGRTFTTVDPAFSKKKTADDSVITTVKFFGDKLYILEQTVGKFDPAELEDKMIYHIKKWKPEKIGIEAIAAQTTISFSLRRRLLKEQIHTTVIEEIRQKMDKGAKIRALIPLYQNGLIYHTRDVDKLETQLLKFPRGRHDDCPDGLQMALYLYDLTPNTVRNFKMPKIMHNKFGIPVLVK